MRTHFCQTRFRGGAADCCGQQAAGLHCLALALRDKGKEIIEVAPKARVSGFDAVPLLPGMPRAGSKPVHNSPNKRRKSR